MKTLKPISLIFLLLLAVSTAAQDKNKNKDKDKVTLAPSPAPAPADEWNPVQAPVEPPTKAPVQAPANAPEAPSDGTVTMKLKKLIVKFESNDGSPIIIHRKGIEQLAEDYLSKYITESLDKNDPIRDAFKDADITVEVSSARTPLPRIAVSSSTNRLPAEPLSLSKLHLKKLPVSKILDSSPPRSGPMSIPTAG